VRWVREHIIGAFLSSSGVGPSLLPSLAAQMWKVLSRIPIGTALYPVERDQPGDRNIRPRRPGRPKISWVYDKIWRGEDEKKGGPVWASLVVLDTPTEVRGYFSPPNDRT
jgi:hypothetical protein